MALTPVQEAQVLDLIAQQSALLSLAGVEATILSKLGATKVTLSDLPTASVIDDADLLLLRQGVTDKSVTGLTFKGLIPTIADASETVKGKVEKATAAEAQAFAADKYIDGERLASAFQGSNQSLSANGYQKLPGGLILQWGKTAPIPYDSQSTTTFPIAFPSACLSAVANFYNTGAFADHCQSFGVGNITTTNFTIQNQWVNSSTSTNFPAVWIAIGY